MSPNELKDLRNLLTTFQVEALGQGDANAGTNLLVTMAITLSNCSGPDVEFNHPNSNA